MMFSYRLLVLLLVFVSFQVHALTLDFSDGVSFTIPDDSHEDRWADLATNLWNEPNKDNLRSKASSTLTYTCNPPEGYECKQTDLVMGDGNSGGILTYMVPKGPDQGEICQQKADQGAVSTDVLVSDEPYLPAQVCDNKCTAFYSGGVTANEYSGTGEDKVYYFNNVTMSYSGDTCTVGDGASSEPVDEQGEDAPKCDEGEQLGTVNGEWSCQPKGGSGGTDGGSDGGGDSGGGDDGSGSDGGSGGDGSEGTAPDGGTTSGTVTLSDGTTRDIEFDTEGLAQEKTNQEIKEGVNDLVEDEGANEEAKDMFEQNMEDEWEKTKIEDQIEKAEEGDVQGLDAESEVDGFAGEVESAFPDVGCSDVNMELAQGHTWSISCADFIQVRNILSWVFYVFTALALFNLFAESGGGKR